MSTRAIEVAILLSFLGASMTMARNAEVSVVPIELNVVGSGGVAGPVRGGVVTVRGDGHLSTHEIQEGRFGLVLPEGVYELMLSKLGYYDVVVSGVKIEKRQAGNQIKTLRVQMVPRLRFVQDSLVTGPRYVEAPPLTAAFRSEDPAVVGHAARGILTITNVGDIPQVLPLEPLEPVPGETPNEAWAMSVSLEIEGLRAAYYGTFACNPLHDCHMLRPGESVEIPIHLLSRRSYGRGRIEPTTWGGSGVFAAIVELYIAHPSPEGELQPTHTRSIRNELWLTILEGPQ